MISYMVGKLAPNSTHSTRLLIKYFPGRGYFRAVSSPNGDKIVTSPPPPPQSLNGSAMISIAAAPTQTDYGHNKSGFHWSLHARESRSIS